MYRIDYFKSVEVCDSASSFTAQMVSIDRCFAAAFAYGIVAAAAVASAGCCSIEITGCWLVNSKDCTN